ncbi:MAG: hypothetical protein ACI9FR_002878 [Cryomorphaceae bacterium]|jgi:hypothetical protein
MIRFISIALLLVAAIAGYFWYSAQSLPSWFDDTQTQEEQLSEQLSEQIKREGVGSFLGSKVSDILGGKLELTETEFNALFLASLKLDEDGRKLLAVSDAIKAIIHQDHIELGAVINLDKVEKVDPKVRKAVEKVNRLFPFLNDSRVALTVYGTPVVRDGKIGIKDDFHIKVGAIPISNDSLRQLGAKVERANTSNLNLTHLSVSSLVMQDGKITLGVLPRF